jgi:hypothetical protein
LKSGKSKSGKSKSGKRRREKGEGKRKNKMGNKEINEVQITNSNPDSTFDRVVCAANRSKVSGS